MLSASNAHEGKRNQGGSYFLPEDKIFLKNHYLPNFFLIEPPPLSYLSPRAKTRGPSHQRPLHQPTISFMALPLPSKAPASGSQSTALNRLRD
jgi:hypothetical protein